MCWVPPPAPHSYPHAQTLQVTTTVNSIIISSPQGGRKPVPNWNPVGTLHGLKYTRLQQQENTHTEKHTIPRVGNVFPKFLFTLSLAWSPLSRYTRVERNNTSLQSAITAIFPPCFVFCFSLFLFHFPDLSCCLMDSTMTEGSLVSDWSRLPFLPICEQPPLYL